MRSTRLPRSRRMNTPAPPRTASRISWGIKVRAMRVRNDSVMVGDSVAERRTHKRLACGCGPTHKRAACGYEGALLQSVPFPFTVKRTWVNTQDGRRLFDGRRRCQHTANMLAFQVFQRHAAADLNAGARRRSDLRRQVRQADLLTGSENHRAFQSVTQFANVSRPRITQKRRSCFLREA